MYGISIEGTACRKFASRLVNYIWGMVFAGSYFWISVHKRMETSNKLLFSLSFHHRLLRFILARNVKSCCRNSTQSGQNDFVLSAPMAAVQPNSTVFSANKF